MENAFTHPNAFKDFGSKAFGRFFLLASAT
jgi:hypothetical protein